MSDWAEERARRWLHERHAPFFAPGDMLGKVEVKQLRDLAALLREAVERGALEERRELLDGKSRLSLAGDI